MTDYTEKTDEELYALIQQIQNTIANRQTLKVFNTQLQRVYTDARDSGAIETPEPGDQWDAPTGAHNAYVKFDTVTHNGKTYRSKIPANTTEPGNTADPQSYRWWTDITDGEPGAQEDGDEWSGKGVIYVIGDERTYEGNLYRVIQGHTSQPGWDPAGLPSLWELVKA